MKKEEQRNEQIRLRRSREVGEKIGSYGVMQVKRREFLGHVTVLNIAERSSR